MTSHEWPGVVGRDAIDWQDITPSEAQRLINGSATDTTVNRQYVNDLGITAASASQLTGITDMDIDHNSTYVRQRLGVGTRSSVRVALGTSYDLIGHNGYVSANEIVDDKVVQAGDRVLLYGQSDSRQNGIYVVNVGRSADMLHNAAGSMVYVREGTESGGHVFLCINDPSTGLTSACLQFAHMPGSVGRDYLNWCDMTSNTVRRLSGATATDTTANLQYIDDLGVHAATSRQLTGASSTDKAVNLQYIDSLGVRARQLGGSSSTDHTANLQYIEQLNMRVGGPIGQGETWTTDVIFEWLTNHNLLYTIGPSSKTTLTMYVDGINSPVSSYVNRTFHVLLRGNCRISCTTTLSKTPNAGHWTFQNGDGAGEYTFSSNDEHGWNFGGTRQSNVVRIFLTTNRRSDGYLQGYLW